GRIERKRLVGVWRVFALKSKEKPGAGFEAINACARDNPDNHYSFIESLAPFDHQACWIINNYYTPPWQLWADRTVKFSSSLDRAAAGDMAAKGITYPQDFVSVRFFCAEKWGVLDVAYLFSPEAEGLSSNEVLSFREADWHVSNIGRFPDKAAYIAKLKDW